MWTSDPLFYPAKPPAHWLMVAEVSGRVLIVPLAPSNTGDPRFPDELLREVRDRAAADDRSVSNWIRRAVEHELARSRD